MARTTTAPAPSVHKTTGLPVQPAATYAVGDLVTEHSMSDGYPGVVVAVSANAVWVRGVRYVLGNVDPQDVPGYNGYGDSATLVIDPESVEEALALGTTPTEIGRAGGATKYMLKVGSKPVGTRESGYYPSQREQDEVGAPVFHKTRWSRAGGYGGLSQGAKFRRDPHV